MPEQADRQSGISRRELLKTSAASGVALLTVNSLVGCKVMDGEPVSRANMAPSHEAWRASLAKHNIARFERRVVQNRWPRLVSRNARKGIHGWGYTTHVLIIHTDTGATGWGLASGMSDDLARALTDQYKGKALTDLFDPAVGIQDDVPKQMDIALHDLAGIILDIPVFRMIGGDKPVPTPCYSGMIYFDDIEPIESQPGIEQVLFNAGADYQFGYRQMKIKVGRGNKWMQHDAGLQRDIDVTNALVEAYPDVTFLADANDGFTLEDTRAYLDGIKTDLLFMEEPFRENATGFAELRRHLNDRDLKTYIADGEASPDAELLDDLIAKKLLDVHLTDLYGLGFTNWRKLMPSLINRGVQTSPHTWGTRLKTVYTAHLASGLGNVLTIEGVTAFSKDIDFADYDPDDSGNIAPPDKPGFGLTLR